MFELHPPNLQYSVRLRVHGGSKFKVKGYSNKPFPNILLVLVGKVPLDPSVASAASYERHGGNCPLRNSKAERSSAATTGAQGNVRVSQNIALLFWPLRISTPMIGGNRYM